MRRRYLSLILLVSALAFAPLSGPARADGLIQPGARMIGPHGCTLNFVFRSPAPAYSQYIGTAGHCVDAVGQRVRMSGGEIGTVAFRVFEGWDDFALIRIDEEMWLNVSPEVRVIGGPTGFTTAESTSAEDGVRLYGHGIVLGDTETTRARSGVLTLDDDREWNAALPAIFGDSGGPVIHSSSGAALGVISGIALGDLSPLHTVKGPTVERVLYLLEESGLAVKLVTA